MPPQNGSSSFPLITIKELSREIISKDTNPKHHTSAQSISCCTQWALGAGVERDTHKNTLGQSVLFFWKWNPQRPQRNPSLYVFKDSHSWNSLISRHRCTEYKLLIQAPFLKLVLQGKLFIKFMKICHVVILATPRSWALWYKWPLPVYAYMQNYMLYHAHM